MITPTMSDERRAMARMRWKGTGGYWEGLTEVPLRMVRIG